MASTLPWTILRPGGLTDQPGTGRVQLGTHVPFGDIPRADVVATAIAALASPASAGQPGAWSAAPTPLPKLSPRQRPGSGIAGQGSDDPRPRRTVAQRLRQGVDH
jgi:NAD(P)H-binding